MEKGIKVIGYIDLDDIEQKYVSMEPDYSTDGEENIDDYADDIPPYDDGVEDDWADEMRFKRHSKWRMN